MNRKIFLSCVQYQHKLEDGSMTMRDIIGKALESGADGLELRRDKWPQLEAEGEALRAHLDELGLGRTFATFTTLFPASDEDAAWLKRDLHIAVALGSPQLRVFQGAAPEDEAHPAWDEARRFVDEAQNRGITIALENKGDPPPGNSLPEIVRALDEIPALKTNVDIGNYAMFNQHIPAAIATLGERIISTHLKDVTETKGYLDPSLAEALDPIFDAFDALPQPVLHCFEFAGGDDPEARIRASLEYLRGRGGKL